LIDSEIRFLEVVDLRGSIYFREDKPVSCEGQRYAMAENMILLNKFIIV